MVCGIAAACVGTAHDQTAPLIEARRADAVRAGYKQVLPSAGQLTDEQASGKRIVAVKRSESAGQTNGYIYTVDPDGYSGKVVIMLGIDECSGRKRSCQRFGLCFTKSAGAVLSGFTDGTPDRL